MQWISLGFRVTWRKYSPLHSQLPGIWYIVRVLLEEGVEAARSGDEGTGRERGVRSRFRQVRGAGGRDGPGL